VVHASNKSQRSHPSSPSSGAVRKVVNRTTRSAFGLLVLSRDVPCQCNAYAMTQPNDRWRAVRRLQLFGGRGQTERTGRFARITKDIDERAAVAAWSKPDSSRFLAYSAVGSISVHREAQVPSWPGRYLVTTNSIKKQRHSIVPTPSYAYSGDFADNRADSGHPIDSDLKALVPARNVPCEHRDRSVRG